MKIDSTLITILVQDLLVPEIIAALSRVPITDESISITLSKDSATIKAVGQAYLDATADVTVPSVPGIGG